MELKAQTHTHTLKKGRRTSAQKYASARHKTLCRERGVAKIERDVFVLFYVCLGFCISSCIKFAFNFVGNTFFAGSRAFPSLFFWLFPPFFPRFSQISPLLFLSHVWPRVIISRDTHTHRALESL